MRATARVRGLPGVVAGLVLAIPCASHALEVTDVSISPGLIVPLGTVITITATLTNENGTFGTLCPNPQLRTAGCGYGGVCTVPDGFYTIFADDPMVVSDPAAVTPTLPFSKTFGETAVVVWTFTATRTGTATFSVMAYDENGAGEGCGDPSLAGDCPPTGVFTPDLLTCGFMYVTVTATLTGRVDAYVVAPTSRPANTAYPDDTIAVVMSVTNTGTTPMTLNAGMSATRAGATALVVPAAAPSFPVGLGAGNAAFLTWTYSVTAVAQPGATAMFYADVERTLGISNSLTIAAPQLAVTATILIDPDGAAPAWATAFASSSYYLVNDELWVVATVTNEHNTDAIDVDPVVILPDAFQGGIADVEPTAPRSPAGVQVLANLTSRTFTWKYRINRNDVYQGCQYTPPPMEFVVRTRGIAVPKLLEVMRDAVSISGGAPATVTVGVPFSVTLWLTNQTGRAIELDASATVFLASDDPGKAVVTAGPAWTGSRVFAPGESLPYVFTVDAVATGSAPLRGGILFPGASTPVAPCFSTPAPFYVQIVPPSPLDISITPSATVVNAGTPYLLTILVSNSTSCPAELTDLHELKEYPRQAPFLVTLDLFSTDCPTFPCSVAPASTVLFTATVTSPECGDADWSGTETGQWDVGCGGAAFGKPISSPLIRIRKAAALADPGSVAWAVSKSSVVEGQTFDVVATVIPAGENDLTAFTLSPAIHFSSTGTAISVQSVPVVPGALPGCGACVTNICPAKAQSFTWTFKADAKGWAGGKVWFTFTATGQDPYDGLVTSSSTTTGMVTIQRPSGLVIGGVVPGEGTVFVDASQSGGVLFGCQVPVVACFEVDGDTGISTTTFLPGAGMTAAPAGLVTLSGSPDLPDLLTPGEHCFTWTFSPVGTGTVNFTVSGVGTEITWGGTAYVVAATAGGAFIQPAALAAIATISASTITTAAGSYVDVVVNVSNAGHVGITNLAATVTVTGSTCGLRAVSDPAISATAWPDVLTTMAGCGDDRVFRWTFSNTANSAGVVSFSITVTGVEWLTSVPLTVTALTACVTILPRPPLLVSLVAASSTIVQGADLNVTVRLDNQGATALSVVPGTQILAANTPDLIPVPPPPPGAVTVAAYSTADVTARISAKGSAAPGPVQITLTPTAFTATDLGVKGAPAVPVTTSGSLTVTVVPPAGPVAPGVTVSDNPWHPLAGPLRLTWGEPAGGAVSLRVLSLTGETVKTLLAGPAPGVSGVIVWDGANDSGQRLAAGVYLLRWESAGRQHTRKLAVVK